MKGEKSKAVIYAYSALAVILWGLSYIWSNRLIQQNIPVEYFVFVRALFAGGLLLVLNLAMGVDVRLHRKDLPKFLVLALCEPFIYFICETYGIGFTESPTYSAMIIATTPIFALFAGIIFFRERLSFTNILGFVICLAGIALVTMSKSSVGERFILGVVLLFVAVVAEVGQACCTKWLAGDYDPRVITMYQFLLGAFYLSPLFFTKGLQHFNPETYLVWSVWEPILMLAIMCSCVCFTLWVSSIKHLGVARSAVLQALIPIATAVAGIILGSELLTLLQWCGIAVASLGVILSQIRT